MTFVTDPAADGAPGAGPAGTEMTGASITYRPEDEDLLLLLRLASLPGPLVGGASGLRYGLAFTLEDVSYEIRALRASATVTAAPASRCTAATRAAPSSGASRAASAPPETRSGSRCRSGCSAREEGAVLGTIRAFTSLGEAAPGTATTLDEAELPDGTVPATRVSLVIASHSTPEASVGFSAQGNLVEGWFSATLQASSLPAGSYRVWARACLTETCGAESVPVELD